MAYPYNVRSSLGSVVFKSHLHNVSFGDMECIMFTSLEKGANRIRQPKVEEIREWNFGNLEEWESRKTYNNLNTRENEFTSSACFVTKFSHKGWDRKRSWVLQAQFDKKFVKKNNLFRRLEFWWIRKESEVKGCKDCLGRLSWLTLRNNC